MRRIFILCLLLLLIVLTVNSSCLSIPSTTTGSISVVVKSLGSQPATEVQYFTIAGHVFSYSYKPYGEGTTLNNIVINNTWNRNSNAYEIRDSDNIQDMITFVFLGSSIKVYFNGVLTSCVQANLNSVDIGGNVVLSNNVVPGTFAYTSEILSASQALARFNTYKSFGNYGTTIIDRFFNECFKKMRGY